MFRRFLPLAVLLAGVTPVVAQTEAPPPHLSVLDGRADVARGTQREPAVANTPLVLGDQLATDDGRAEVLLGDGSALHLDEHTTVDFNGDTVVRLVHGRLIVLAERSAAGSLQIDTSPASVRIQSSAEVHLSLVDTGGQATLLVEVVRGIVDIEAGAAPVSVGAGQQVFVREGEAPSYPGPFNSARLDGFMRWSQALVDGRRGATSAQYLPADVRVYGSTFDQYGSWSYDAPYGYVWYPRVATTWRPYYHGRWHNTGRYGWTFIGYEPWGWATHHYGRWGIGAGGSWFWIPSGGWGAAWVHWAVAPGYVGWCPLGWNNRPVVGFWGHGSRSAYYGGPGHGYDDPSRAWSVVPTRSFRTGSPVHGQPFDPRPLTGPRAPAFVMQPTAPSTAIPRGSVVAPGYRVAGPSVVPRDGQSRRGPSSSDSGSRYRTPPAAASSAAAVAPRAVPPAVIYHRGTSIDPSTQSSGASAYERAGVAVPRGLPAERGAMPGPAGADPRATYSDEAARERFRNSTPSVSPYSGYTSPYSRGLTGTGDPGVNTARPGDHPDYAVPRGGDRYSSPQQYRGPDRPQYRGPDSPQYRAPDSPRSGGPERSPQREAPRAEPRSGPTPRSEGGSRASGAPAGPRSGGDRGSSSGSAVRRR